MGAFFSRGKSVQGQVVLVTGGGMGIGRLIALRFAKLGAHVIIWDLKQETVSGVVDEIINTGGSAEGYEVDVTNRELVYSTAETILSKHIAVDILINNAGIVSGKPLLEMKDSMIEKTMNVNALSHFWTVKAFLPAMLYHNKGHIVSIASLAAVYGCGGMCDYSASKGAAVLFMESLRQELDFMNKTGVKLTTVCPSFMNTGMFAGVSAPLAVPLLEPEYAADAIVSAIRKNRYRLVLPEFLAYIEAGYHVLPAFVGHFLVRLMGLHRSMSTFKQTRAHALQMEKSA